MNNKKILEDNKKAKKIKKSFKNILAGESKSVSKSSRKVLNQLMKLKD